MLGCPLSNLLPCKMSGYFKSIPYKSKDFLKVLTIWLLNDDVTLCQDWWRSSCFLKCLQLLCAHGLGKLCSLLCPSSYVYGNLCGMSSLFWFLSEWRAAIAVLCGHQIHRDGANDGWLSVGCPYCNPPVSSGQMWGAHRKLHGFIGLLPGVGCY